MRKILNKANPSTENFNEASKEMSEVEKLFKRQIKGQEDIQTLELFIKQLIENQDADGYWKLIASDDMPYDAKVEYWKYPTILFTSIMIHFNLNHPVESASIDGFERALMKALYIVERGQLSGHGFDSFNFMINALKTLAQSGVMDFILRYPVRNSAFTELIKYQKIEIEGILNKGKTIFEYGIDYKLRLEEVIDIMNGKNKVYLFVYGTLMRGNQQGQTYLDSQEFRCECTLYGFALYDLGQYPGIVKNEDGKVKGELYQIPESKLAEIDIYEAEGSIYRREMTKVYTSTNEPVDAYVYIYNQPVDGQKIVEFESQPWNKVTINKNYIWYACYGSNINKDRFMGYIERCCDNTPPIEERQFIINHPIYFAKKSRKWHEKGVAFLDIGREGMTYGKIYLITKDQFKDIRQEEGPGWYNKIVDLGIEDGTSIKTFTHAPRYQVDIKPSKKYIDVISRGIKDTYPNLNEIDIDAYLMESYLNYEEIDVLRFLRAQPHGVALDKVHNDLNIASKVVVEVVRNLRDLELIKQDSRSVDGDIVWNSPDAIYYSIKKRREAIDNVIDRVEANDSYIINRNYIKDMDMHTLVNIINNLPKVPIQREYTVINYERSPLIKEYARRRANGICELCNTPAPFNDTDGKPFLEVHHIKWLSDGGNDSIDNTVALCPNCHRRVHVLSDPEDINKLLMVAQ